MPLPVSEQRLPLPSLTYELAPKAYQLFRAWTACVKYERRQFAPEVLDERFLILDLEDALLQGLQDLSESPKAKGKSTRWAAGFLGGFTLARLNRIWYRKYLLPLQAPYRQALWIKAIISLLDQDTEVRAETNRLFERLLNQHFPFGNEQAEELADLLPIQERVLTSLQAKENWAQYRHYLDELLETYFQEAMSHDGHAYLTDPERFFTRKELAELVLHNPYED